ncbi:MAG TPA: hypothetical protein VIB01_10660 [Steroidobacteraceae bacterium]|jgi:hypothetical protein
MNPLVPLATAITVSLVLSSAILFAITRPLRRVLARLCRDGESTSFWVAFTAVMLYIAPLFFAVFWTPIYLTEPVPAFRTALVSALFGAFAGMLVIGYKIAGAVDVKRN